MIYTRMTFYNCIDSKKAYVTFNDDKITECPLCHKLLTPKALIGCVYSDTTKIFASVLYVCNGCHSAFMATFELASESSSNIESYYSAKHFIECAPIKYTEQIFDKSISCLSPQFVKIYNQALAAETSGLDEIAGLGYRKALEFLIKDFAIHEHPDDEEDIKKMMLSPCIQKYIDNDRIKTLSERSVWIGNDEAHYIRKQEDRDVSDMKAFIKATVYFISMVMITEDAATITPVK